MATQAHHERPPYRIEIRRFVSKLGQRKQHLTLTSGIHAEVSLYAELDGPQEMWGVITLWNKALNEFGNDSVRIDDYTAKRLLKEVLGQLDFSVVAQNARRAALMQQAA